MRVDQFDFTLPEERIALRPAAPRDSARMLVVEPQPALRLSDTSVADLPRWMKPGDALVFNDTKVIPAQLFGRKGAARIGLTLHKRVDAHRWWAFVKNVRRLRRGDAVSFGADLVGVMEELADGGEALWRFEGDDPLETVLSRHGVVPLPPYIAARRAADARDAEDYQTIFASRAGAVAAPTAGLHFTDKLLASIVERGVLRIDVTLHVGAGTFLPVKAEDTAGHRMHAEWGTVSATAADTLNAVRAAGGRIIAVGTTSLRLLESAARDDGFIQPFAGDTDIFITPGYRFKAIDLLMTNFHLPRSTLYMLVSAFSGLDAMRTAYAHAIAEHYRFYSYGDACLLHPAHV